MFCKAGARQIIKISILYVSTKMGLGDGANLQDK